mgnify:CR=1 FL=1
MTERAIFLCRFDDQQKAFETLGQYRVHLFGIKLGDYQNFKNGCTCTPLTAFVCRGETSLLIKYGVEGDGTQYQPMFTTTISWYPDASGKERNIVFTKQTGLVVTDDLQENVDSLYYHMFGIGVKSIRNFASAIEPFRQMLDLQFVETLERQIDMATLTQHTDIEYFKTALAILNTVVDLEYSEIGKNK